MTAAKTQDRSIRSLLLEGGVIVVSILLAFALDALWDETKRGREAQIALTSLKDEFEANLAACEEVEQHYHAMAKQFAEVLTMSDERVRALGDAEATVAYNSFCAPRTFDAMLGTTNSVISTGTFSILQDAELRRELDIFLNLMEDTHEDIQNMLHFMRVLGEYEVTIGGPWGKSNPPAPRTPDTSYFRMLSGDKLAALLRDPQYTGRVQLYHGCAGWYCSELDRLAEQIRKVLQLINALQA